MNGVMVLAMVPMIVSGCGLNFGLPLGIIAGLLGAVTSIEIGIPGIPGVLIAMTISLPIAVVLGWGYGLLLNRVKGSEMMIATYVGFSSVAFMCIMWLVLPYKSSNMVWGYAGKGLRTTIAVEGFWHQAISDIGSFSIGQFFYVPTGMFLFFALLCWFMWVFMRTRTGTAMTTVGSNPEYARACLLYTSWSICLPWHWRRNPLCRKSQKSQEQGALVFWFKPTSENRSPYGKGRRP